MINLDLDDDDDLLELPDAKPAVKLQRMWPDAATQLKRCVEFASDVKRGRVTDVDYAGTLPELQLWTYIELFEYWYRDYQRKPAPLKLETAFLAAVKCRAGHTFMQVQSKLLPGWTGRAEVIDVLGPHAVRLLIALPFDCTRIRPNVENSKHWRAVWVNPVTKLPVSPAEPFKLL